MSDEGVQELTDRAVALANSVKEFQDDLKIVGVVGDIEGRTTETEKANKKNRRWIKITIAGLILDLLLTFGGVGLFERINDNTHTIKTVQCSLYSLVLSGGYHPANHLSDEGASTTQSLAVYNGVYKEIIRQNNTLGCTPATEPTYVTDPAKITTK